jgi:predicted RNase H-like HicB family nuclease
MIDPSVQNRELHVDVHEEDGSYWGQVREFPGCFATGSSAAELIESAEEAVVLCLAPPDQDPPAVAVRLNALQLSVELDRPLDHG